MFEGNPASLASSMARPKARVEVESLEERQWRLLMEQARVRVAQEEAEWKLLIERARAATDNEEREWQRLRTKADLKTSGAFPAVGTDYVDSVAPPSRRASARKASGTDYVDSVASSSGHRSVRTATSVAGSNISLWP